MRSRVWTRQPPPGTPIDWDNPLTEGLVALYSFGDPGMVDSCRGDHLTLQSGSRRAPTGNGIGLSATSNSAYGALGTTYPIVGAGAWSAIALFSTTQATTGESNCIATWGGNSTGTDFYLSIENGVIWSRNFSNYASAGSGLNTGKFHVVGLSKPANGTVANLTFYADGTPQTISSQSGTSVITLGTVDALQVGGDNRSNLRGFIGAIPLLALYNSVVSPNAQTVAAANPWQLFWKRWRFYSIAASGGSTITGSAAIDESSDIASGSGSISIAGSAGSAEGTDTASGAGGVSIAGAASATESADAASATGAAGSSITGSGSASEGADIAAGTGAVSIVGAGAAAEQADTPSGAGAISVSATGSVHEGADTAAAAGSLSIAGAATATEGIDTASGTGSATGTLGTAGSIPSVARYTIRRQVARNFTVWRAFPRNFTVRRSLVRVFEVNSVSIRFPVKGPAEATPLTFDFSADLPSGVTLSGAPTMSIACTEGTDANAANVISGSVALNAGKTAVVQDGTGGLDGCEYTITCTCATTQSNLTLTLVGILAVRANLN